MEFVVLEKNGLRKEVKVGFSWTVFFFGLFVPLFRGDLKWAAIMFFGTILLGFCHTRYRRSSSWNSNEFCI